MYTIYILVYCVSLEYAYYSLPIFNATLRSRPSPRRTSFFGSLEIVKYCPTTYYYTDISARFNPVAEEHIRC